MKKLNNIQKLIWEQSAQVEILDYVTQEVKSTLDIHNPMNKGEKIAKKIWRFPMSNSSHFFSSS